MSKRRHIRDEGHVRILLRQGGWIEVGRATNRVSIVRDKNDPGDLVESSIFDRLKAADLIKRKKSTSGLVIWAASPSLMASEKKA